MTHSRSSLLRDVRTDLRYAVRLFARQPAILLLTIVGLSLGLGVSTAAFSVMNVAILRGQGLVDPDRAPVVLRTTDLLAAAILAVLLPTRRAATVNAADVLRRS